MSGESAFGWARNFKKGNEKDRPKTVSLPGALFKACEALFRIPRHQRGYY